MSQEYDMFAMMEDNKPLASYKKTILGKVFVYILNPFDEKEVQGHILKGNPNSNNKEVTVDVWSTKQKMFFENANQRHFKEGTLVPFDRQKVKKQKIERMYSDYTDDDIEEIVNKPWYGLKKVVDEAKSEAFLGRILMKAEELEKSEKVTNLIKENISRVQGFSGKPVEEVVIEK